MAAVAIALSADHGAVALSGRYHAPCGAVKGTVLIAGAMGVKQDYYAEFAQWLAAQGYVALSFDYRGMGESLPAGRSLRGFLHRGRQLADFGAVYRVSRRPGRRRSRRRAASRRRRARPAPGRPRRGSCLRRFRSMWSRADSGRTGRERTVGGRRAPL